MRLDGVLTFRNVTKPPTNDLYLLDYRNDPRRGVPCVYRTGELEDNTNFSRATFNQKWQIFAADLLAMRKYGVLYFQLSGDALTDIIRAFGSLYSSDRAFTNNAGVNNKTNYIEGIDRGEDPKIDPLVCGGNQDGKAVQVLATQENSSGILMGKINMFAWAEIPPLVTPALLTDPRIGRATVINNNGLLNNFTQLKDENWVPYPLITSRIDTECWYPVNGLYQL